MTDIVKAIILGIIEGITEFLPISSTGHLILANRYIAFSEMFTQKFDIIIQLGAILAVVVVYWKTLVPNKENSLDKSFSIWSRVIVAVIPALVLGALLHEQIETLLFNPFTVAVALVFWGIVLVVIERRPMTTKTDSIGKISYTTALFIGLIQCLAMVPGTSRSAATIIGAMLLGSSRLVAVEFSFFLAIPTLAAASVFSMFKMGFNISSSEFLALATGFLVSFIVAYAVIRYFLRYIGKHDFQVFGYYRILLGAIILFFFLFNTK